MVESKANTKQYGGNSIRLTRQYACLVDNDIYQQYGNLKWSAVTPSKNTVYAVKYIDGIYTYLHRLILNAPKGVLVDHINGDTLDNRRHNLRLCNKSQNAINQFNSYGQSSYKGVWKRQNRNKCWVAEVHHLGVKYHLGSFYTEQEAAIAYNTKAVELFGEFARENTIDC